MKTHNHRTRAAWKFILPALLLTAASSPSAEDNPSRETVPGVVELPAYTVRGSRVLPPPESWRYVRIIGLEVSSATKQVWMNGYEVLSNMPVQNTTVFARELQLRQLASALFWPSLGSIKGHRPLVLVDRTDDPWAQDPDWKAIEWEGDARPEMPTVPTDTNQLDGFDMQAQFPNPDPAPDAAETMPVIPDILPLSDGLASTHWYNGILTVRVRGGGQLGGGAMTEERLAGQANEACAKAVLAEEMLPPPAAWLRRGIGWLIDSLEVSQTGFAISSQPIKINRRGNVSLAPLKEIFAHYNGNDQAHSLTAAAFTQYCLYGDGGKHAAHFFEFVDLSKEGAAVTDDMFKKCFKMSIAKMDRTLTSFTSSMSVLRSSEQRGLIPPMPDIEVREATQSEIARIQGDILMAEGNAPRALEVLRIAYWRGERAPELLAALAEVELLHGSIDRARKLLASLMAAPDPSLRTRVAAARLRFIDLKNGLEEGGKLMPEDTSALLSTLAQASREGPPHENLCELIAEIVVSSQGHPGDSLTQFIKQSAARYPQNKPLEMAVLHIQ
jgi:hypothetical protein